MMRAAAAQQHSIEKRRHRRRRVWLSAVLISSDAETPAWIRDISCKGAMIETEATPAPGDHVVLLRKGLETGTVVAWVRKPFVGITFDEPFAEKDLVEYSLPRAPRTQMRQVHGYRRPSRAP